MLPMGHGMPCACNDHGQQEQQDDDAEDGPQALEDIREFYGAHDETDGKNISTSAGWSSVPKRAWRPTYRGYTRAKEM
jgi:hypothetical protein